MKRRSVTTAIFLSFIFFVLNINQTFGQTELVYGLRFGTGTSKITFNKFMTESDSIFYKFYPQDKNDVNAHFGLYARAKKNHFFVQSELLYTFTAGDIIMYSDGMNDGFVGPSIGIGSHYFIHMRLPMLIGLEGDPFNFHFGPMIDYLAYKDDMFYYKESDEKFSLSYLIGAEITIYNFFLTARYSNNITPIAELVIFRDQKFKYDLKTPQFMFSLGFILGKKSFIKEVKPIDN